MNKLIIVFLMLLPLKVLSFDRPGITVVVQTTVCRYNETYGVKLDGLNGDVAVGIARMLQDKYLLFDFSATKKFADTLRVHFKQSPLPVAGVCNEKKFSIEAIITLSGKNVTDLAFTPEPIRYANYIGNGLAWQYMGKESQYVYNQTNLFASFLDLNEKRVLRLLQSKCILELMPAVDDGKAEPEWTFKLTYGDLGIGKNSIFMIATLINGETQPAYIKVMKVTKSDKDAITAKYFTPTDSDLPITPVEPGKLKGKKIELVQIHKPEKYKQYKPLTPSSNP